MSRVVVRKVRHNGTVLIDDVGYYIKQSLAGQYVSVWTPTSKNLSSGTSISHEKPG